MKERRYARRLLLLVVWLLLIDRAVPPLLEALEQRHYEHGQTFRFESSDLFGIRPFVQYLREHPRHDRPRIVFLGNSMIFGYGLTSGETIPAQFQKLTPGARVYNAAVNQEHIGTSDLIAKDIIDSVDTLVVLDHGEYANPMLGTLIPVDEGDRRFFHLDKPNRAEAAMQSWLGRVWRLYAVNDRLQAAIFGTSTRVFLYAHKRELAHLRWPSSGGAAGPPPPMPAHVSLRAPRAPHAPASLLPLWVRAKVELAYIARAHRKRVVFLRFEYDNAKVDDADVGALNAMFGPYAEEVIITLPPGTTFDTEHPVAAATAEIAALLAQHEREEGRR